ncbi:HAD family hydrolase [Paraflavitalea pollutisoli]|uniref:HAD family hydrolase n=1 Tax=Paraflavitalea pollutisoli TaxID=3034143 RepID=UPI0023EB9AF5|nr:HAD family phosphatase [Paraflavitalea sp. H1-2-19X]
MNEVLQRIADAQAVIFDMDGTLIDSTEADYLAWKRVFAEHQVDLTFEQYFPLLGRRSHDVVKEGLGLEGAALDTALSDKMRYFNEVIDTHGFKMIEGAKELVEKVSRQGVKLGLATSSRRPKMTLVMERAGLLGYFDVTVTGDEVINGKPAPEIFLTASQRLGIAPENCIAFEDAANGVRAAKQAGMHCVAITTTHTAAQLYEADLVIDSYQQLYGQPTT